jgi:hypothetical protein
MHACNEESAQEVCVILMPFVFLDHHAWQLTINFMCKSVKHCSHTVDIKPPLPGVTVSSVRTWYWTSKAP